MFHVQSGSDPIRNLPSRPEPGESKLGICLEASDASSHGSINVVFEFLAPLSLCFIPFLHNCLILSSSPTHAPVIATPCSSGKLPDELKTYVLLGSFVSLTINKLNYIYISCHTSKTICFPKALS